MKRPAVILALTLVLAACGAATAPSGSPVSSDPPILLATAPPSPTATPGPVVHAQSIYSVPQADDLFRGSRIASMTGSPTGAVILGTDSATGALESWTSTDGDTWQRHWLPGETFGGGSPELVVGADFGFVAAGWRFDGQSFRGAMWLSSDGVSWSESPDTGLPSGLIRSLVAGPAGIAIGVDVGGFGGSFAASLDGRTWRAAEFPSGATPNADGLVALPAGFMVTGSVDGLDSSGGTISASMIWRSGDGLAWTADARLAKDLSGRPNGIEAWTLSPYGAVGSDVSRGIAAITASGLDDLPGAPSEYGRLVGGPAGLYWIAGTQVSATCSAAWQFDGRTWQPLDLGAKRDPCADGLIILGSAPVSGGLVVLGILGDSPSRSAWLMRAPGNAPSAVVAGGPVASAPKSSIPDALAATIGNLSTCPAVPTSVDQVIGLDPWLGAGCFGDQAIAFRAWVVDPGEGFGGTCEAFMPAWIRECVLPDYLLSSGAGIDPNSAGSKELHAMRSPSATGDLAGVGRWVQVTGHYDDPASPTCRFSGGEGAIDFEPERPRAEAVLQCREVFVVTHLRTVPAA
jgi:hypothetical protein